MNRSGEPLELVVSAGDPQGVGPEVAVKAVRIVSAAEPGVQFVLVGDRAVWRASLADPAWPSIRSDEAPTAPVSILEVSTGDAFADPPPSSAGGRAARASLDAALARVRALPARRALVTAPLSKEAVRMAGDRTFDGHTGYIAARCGTARPIMLFAAPGFRVALATVHVALRRVSEIVTADYLARFLRILAFELRRRYGIPSPRIDVLGLNPHAGEGGAFGDEEHTALIPAIRSLQAAGESVAGPFPADSYFLEGFAGRADCAVAMYHDQGLVAVKSLAFKEAVNVTLGLPLIRTSPDHGTAFGIAGKDAADPAPMAAALREAVRLLRAVVLGRESEIPPEAGV